MTLNELIAMLEQLRQEYPEYSNQEIEVLTLQGKGKLYQIIDYVLDKRIFPFLALRIN